MSIASRFKAFDKYLGELDLVPTSAVERKLLTHFLDFQMRNATATYQEEGIAHEPTKTKSN